MIEWGPISINTLIQVLGFVGGIALAWVGLKSDIFSLKKDVQRLEEGFKQLSNILTQVAIQDTRLAMVEKSVDELRHGHGYVIKTNG